MASDPNQGPSDNPNTDYGSPPTNPYGGPQNPYSNPENPYNNPFNESYGQAGPGLPPPTGSPLPLGEAVRQLPSQWIRVLTHPGAVALAEESGKASWDIVWVQLIISAVITAIFSFLVTLEGTSFMTVPTAGSSSSNTSMLLAVRSVTTGISFAEIIIVPIGFFIGMGIFFGLAKAFGGQGRFVTQSYTFLLYQVPLGIGVSILSLIPIAGSFIGFAVIIYEIVLDVFAIMAVHRLSGGKATAVILIPIGVLFLLVCALVVVFVVIFAAALQTH